MVGSLRYSLVRVFDELKNLQRSNQMIFAQLIKTCRLTCRKGIDDAVNIISLSRFNFFIILMRLEQIGVRHTVSEHCRRLAGEGGNILLQHVLIFIILEL